MTASFGILSHSLLDVCTFCSSVVSVRYVTLGSECAINYEEKRYKMCYKDINATKLVWLYVVLSRIKTIRIVSVSKPVILNKLYRLQL